MPYGQPPTQSSLFTQRDQALALLRQRGLARLSELKAQGITATTVSRMERHARA